MCEYSTGYWVYIRNYVNLKTAVFPSGPAQRFKLCVSLLSLTQDTAYLSNLGLPGDGASPALSGSHRGRESRPDPGIHCPVLPFTLNKENVFTLGTGSKPLEAPMRMVTH